MSTAYNNKKKAKRAVRESEECAILRDIRKGRFPRFYHIKENDGTNRLERSQTLLRSRRGTKTRVKNKLTWRVGSTLTLLMSISDNKKKPEDSKP